MGTARGKVRHRLRVSPGREGRNRRQGVFRSPRPDLPGQPWDRFPTCPTGPRTSRAHIWQPYRKETQYVLGGLSLERISTIALHVAALVKRNESDCYPADMASRSFHCKNEPIRCTGVCGCASNESIPPAPRVPTIAAWNPPRPLRTAT